MGYGWSGQYYSLILFQLLLLYPILRKVYDHKVLRYLVLAFLGVLYLIYVYGFEFVPPLIKKFGRLPFLFWLPYVFAGIALARAQKKKPVFY